MKVTMFNNELKNSAQREKYYYYFLIKVQMIYHDLKNQG